MKIISNQNGFTYILALTVVMIMGIMLGMVGQSWETIKQRELEEELIFRGDQVAELVYQGSLCKNPTLVSTLMPQAAVPQAAVPQYFWLVDSPKGTVLDDLLIGKEEQCANGTTKKFRLRVTATLDPLTNKPWHIIKPVGDPAHFSGVASDSKKKPFKKSFKDIYDTDLLNDKQTYSDWSFTWELKLPPLTPNPNLNLNPNPKS